MAGGLTDTCVIDASKARKPGSRRSHFFSTAYLYKTEYLVPFAKTDTIRRMRFTTQWRAAFGVKSFSAVVVKTSPPSVYKTHVRASTQVSFLFTSCSATRFLLRCPVGWSYHEHQASAQHTQHAQPLDHPGARIMEADDCQVTTVFTVQPSFHHRHSTNPVS